VGGKRGERKGREQQATNTAIASANQPCAKRQFILNKEQSEIVKTF
jgi:hypothetical protein